MARRQKDEVVEVTVRITRENLIYLEDLEEIKGKSKDKVIQDILQNDKERKIIIN